MREPLMDWPPMPSVPPCPIPFWTPPIWAFLGFFGVWAVASIAFLFYLFPPL